MINHRSPPQTEWYYDDYKNGYIVKACEDISKGAEVTISYGDHLSAHDIFFRYGFIADYRHQDEAIVPLSLDHTDPLYASKFRASGSASRMFKIRADLENDCTV